MNHIYRQLWILILCPALCMAQLKVKENRLYDRVQSEKAKASFPEVHLFSQANFQPDANRSIVLSNAIFLTPDAAQFQAVKEKAYTNLRMSIPSPDGIGKWTLELSQVEVTTSDFKVKTSDGKTVEYQQVLHYRGIFNNNPNSSVFLSVSENGLMAVLADSSGNYDLGIYGEPQQNLYVLYRSNEIADRLPFDCKAAETKSGPDRENSTEDAGCRVVRVYLECDYTMFQSKGSVSAVANYVTGLFNVVAGLYANESIESVISEIFVWTSADPYINLTPSSSVLYSFQSTRTSYNGSLAHLLSTRSTNLGGVAFVNVLCNPYSSYAFSNIYNSYSLYPTYSWSVMVVAHEMGHNLGSQHTQWCGWPGGAIDNCYTTEGGCAQGPAPVNGGTIMSYCHLVGGVGINLQNGFGPLPGGVIRDRVQAATCISSPLILTGTASTTATVCPGQPVNLSVLGGNTYSWSPATGLNATTGAAVIASPLTTTTYTVTGTSGGCTGTASITVNVSPTLSFGLLVFDNQTFSGSGNPNPIEFSALPMGGNGTFTYQWYSQTGLVSVPTGTSASGWTLIPGATSSSYDPGVLTISTTFAVQVDPTGSPDCSPPVWAGGVRQIAVNAATGLNPGILTAGNQTFCSSGGNPSIITFSQLPSGFTGYTYKWYYRDGIQYTPGGSNTSGWTLISGATASSYDPPTVTVSRMYACLVTPSGGNGEWAAGGRQIMVLPTFNAGTVTAGDQTLCNPADPSNITFSIAPSGSGAFKYQWYYQNALVTCPTGSSTLGWTPVSGGTASSFDPTAGGTTTNRTFAVRVSPSGSPTCGTVQWATNCRKITLPPPINLGAIVSGYDTVQYYGIPDTIRFANMPVGSGSFNFQWYMKDGLVAAPTGTNVTGWTPVDQANSPVYVRQYGLASTSTFACFVLPSGNPTCGSGGWASGARWVTVLPQVSYWGSLEVGNETLCYNSADPDTIEFATLPIEIPNPTYQWYYWDTLITQPIYGAAAILIPGATTTSYDPPSGLTRSRTYSCLVGYGVSQPGGTSGVWALPLRQITVLPQTEPGSVTPGDETFCGSGNPANITLNVNPKGSGAYQWRWYYRENATGACPTGSTIPIGWITNNTSPNITGTTLTGSGISFDPQSAGALNKGRTFAVFITPISNSQGLACTTPQWATGCRRFYVNSCNLASEPAVAEYQSQAFSLGQSFPNPASGRIAIRYFLSEMYEKGAISIYDLCGKRVQQIEVLPGFEQKVEMDCSVLPAGSYYYCLESNGLRLDGNSMVIQK